MIYKSIFNLCKEPNNFQIEEFAIAPNQYGTRWDVFDIVNGKIVRVDEVK